jgi:hypothetical protein
VSEGISYFREAQEVKVGKRLWIKLTEVNIDGAYITEIVE